MKKWLIILSSVFIIAILTIGALVYDFLNVELDELSKGEFLSEHPSPYNELIARAYVIDEGGATVRAAIRAEIDFGDEIKTIYWNYDESTAKISWIDGETININDHELNIFNDTYHWKKDTDWERNRGKY